MLPSKHCLRKGRANLSQTHSPAGLSQRCLIFCKSGQVQLVSRNKLLITGQYPELASALAKQVKGDAVLDGEIVAFEKGRPSFEIMQKRMHVEKPSTTLQAEVKVFLYLFDVLFFEGYDTKSLT